MVSSSLQKSARLGCETNMTSYLYLAKDVNVYQYQCLLDTGGTCFKQKRYFHKVAATAVQVPVPFSRVAISHMS